MTHYTEGPSCDSLFAMQVVQSLKDLDQCRTQGPVLVRSKGLKYTWTKGEWVPEIDLEKLGVTNPNETEDESSKVQISQVLSDRVLRWSWSLKHQCYLLRSHVEGRGWQPHPYGGGLVASTAEVDRRAYVGPNAVVAGHARVQGRAKIYNYATVQDRALVCDQAYVYGDAVVGGNAIVMNDAQVKDSAVVLGRSVIQDRALVRQNAKVLQGVISQGSVVFGEAVVTEDSRLQDHAKASGTAVVKGGVILKGSTHVEGTATPSDTFTFDVEGVPHEYSKGNTVARPLARVESNRNPNLGVYLKNLTRGIKGTAKLFKLNYFDVSYIWRLQPAGYWRLILVRDAATGEDTFIHPEGVGGPLHEKTEPPRAETFPETKPAVEPTPVEELSVLKTMGEAALATLADRALGKAGSALTAVGRDMLVADAVSGALA